MKILLYGIIISIWCINLGLDIAIARKTDEKVGLIIRDIMIILAFFCLAAK